MNNKCVCALHVSCGMVHHPVPATHADGVGRGDAGCWRDPLPFVTKTAVMLVSTLAVLFYALAEDVRSLAEDAGLKWRWQKVEGSEVDEGIWEGDCDKVREDLFGCFLAWKTISSSARELIADPPSSPRAGE